ncbi:VCBS repeat-containing protein [Acidobacteria bacterium AH-259-A15]|nr:VCBS repeat-containing protein [Acidobacteria bacterium AH-259-A15]
MSCPRTGKWAGLFCVALIALCIPALSCFTTDSTESTQNNRPENSKRVPSIQASPDQEVAQQPVSIVLREREALKRGTSELGENIVEHLPHVNDPFPELVALSPDEEIFSGASVDPNQRVIEAGGGLRNSSQMTGFIGSRKPSIKKQVGTYDGDLMLLDYAYRAALLNLFNNPFFDGGRLANAGRHFDESLFANDDLLGDHNPFEEALLSQEMADVQQSAQVASDSAMPLQDPEPRSELQVLASLGGPVQGDLEGPFDFLLIGDLSVDGRRRVFRATRDQTGEFILDDFSTLTRSGGFMVFEEGEQLLTADLNNDGLADLVVVKETSGSSLVEVFLAREGIRFERATSLSIPNRVIGISAFEMSGDEKDDLVILLEGNPRLLIYEAREDRFAYLKELVLAFSPALLAESRDGTLGSRRFDIFDPSLTQVATFGSGAPGMFTESQSSILAYFEVFSLDSFTGGPLEVLVLDYGGRITLAEKTLNGVRFLGSFAVTEKMPLVILGDYFRSGRRQLIFQPVM